MCPSEDPSPDRVERSCDAETHLGTAVALAVSEVTGVPASELDFALNDYVDADALDALFAPKNDGTARPSGRVVFEVDGCEVTVHGDGRVAARATGDE
ncbi:HalOD1 output domain-containing protein [Halobium palmae]|uniref:HalOD1 output domain-containing protein n=1 Tax=Halobium palmae TaxID=1776492 RepID=A0ABD5S1P8_9EURY